MDRDLVRRQVVAVPLGCVELQHAREHRGDPLAVSDAVLLNGLQGLCRVEPRHVDDGAAKGLRGRAEPQRCRVVERRGGEVDGILVESPEHALQHPQRTRVLRDGRFRQRPQDALRPAGGAGAVQHHPSCRLLRQGLGRVVRDGFLEVPVAVDRAVEHQPGVAAGREPVETARHLRPGTRCNEHLRLGVFEDVARFFIGQVAVDRRQIQARPKGGPDDIEPGEVVLGEDRNMVAPPQADVEQELRQLVGPVVQFTIGPAGAGIAVYRRRLVRKYFCPIPWIHAALSDLPGLASG